MVKLYETGAYLLNGSELIADDGQAQAVLASKGVQTTKEDASKNTMAYGILEAHNTSGNMEQLKIKFDKMTSHDITFVGIIQTARASGLTEQSMRTTMYLVFPVQRNMVESMYHLIRRLSISSQEKCLRNVVL